MRRLALAAVLLAVPLVQAQSAPEPTYVAMGSSFAAGPGIPKPDPASPPRCARSTENYAHLFAAARGLILHDVSCSGATTADILDGSAALPPQLDAVTPATRLVTITIGGNDVAFIRNLYAWSCQSQPATPNAEPHHCGNPMPPAEVEAAFVALPGHLRAIVTRIHERAPQARVVFIDYITIVPATGSCPDRLPLTPEQADQARATAHRLAALTAEVAQSTGALVLKASELSADHDVCAIDPWASPIHPQSGAPQAIFAPYHPNAQAMRAIAEGLAASIPKE
ncbi:MAG: SGNH/GDSL hydrolase family protein [Terracidiphilus sp.]|nr:SGNH/GDSL hydrolase family protein [Terracidiphilus sp.]